MENTEATYDEIIETVVKHLPGKHNQESHGGPDTGGKVSRIAAGVREGAAKTGKSVEDFAMKKLDEAEVTIKRELDKFKKSDDWGTIKALGSGVANIAKKNVETTGKVAQAAGRAYVGAVKRNVQGAANIAGRNAKTSIKAALYMATAMNPVIGTAVGIYSTAKLAYKGKKAVEGLAAGAKEAGVKFNEADQKVHAWSAEKRKKLFGKSGTEDTSILNDFQEIIAQLDAAKQSPQVDEEDKDNLDKIRSIFSALQEQAR